MSRTPRLALFLVLALLIQTEPVSAAGQPQPAGLALANAVTPPLGPDGFLPDTTVILRVGSRQTRVRDFRYRYFTSYPEYRPGLDSLGRIQFLSTLATKDILALTALALKHPLRFEDRVVLRETRQRALSQAVQQRFIRDSVQVDSKEVDALYESYRWIPRLRHILVADRNAAEQVRRALISGQTTWAAAVKRYSLATDNEGPNGEIGWIQRDKLERTTANLLCSLRPGQYSLPFLDKQGWHIVQCTERKPAIPPDFSGIRKLLITDIRDRMMAERAERLFGVLRAEEQVHYDTTNAIYASARFGNNLQMKFGMSIEIDATVPEFAPSDTARILATWRNGRFTIGTLIHAYSEVPAVLRPSLNAPESVIGFIEALILDPSIAAYGEAHGLAEDSLVVTQTADKLEQIMVERMYSDSISSRIWVSREERKAHYEANLNRYFTYASVDFAAIVRHSKTGADSVAQVLRAGTKAVDLLAADSLRGTPSGSLQTRYQNESGPYQKSLFEEMRSGDIQVRGPDRNGDYVVLQSLAFNSGRQLSFQESDAMIAESLQNQKESEALKALVERASRRLDVVSRPEWLQYIQMVDPTLDL